MQNEELDFTCCSDEGKAYLGLCLSCRNKTNFIAEGNT